MDYTWTLKFFLYSSKVTEKDACAIARAVWEEFEPFLPPTTRPPSSEFLTMATRLSTTGHENRLSDQFGSYGLSADIPVKNVDVGLKAMHPVLPVSNTVQTLAANRKLDLLLMGNRQKEFEAFWSEWRKLDKHHPIYDVHPASLGSCIPVAVHCDEGTTLKKKGIMVISWQCLMGRGTTKRKSTQQEPGCNMVGHSLTSRFLWSVMLTRLYTGKKLKNRPLHTLIEHLSQELSDAFYYGCEVSLSEESQRFF